MSQHFIKQVIETNLLNLPQGSELMRTSSSTVFFSRAEHERRKPSDVEWLKTIANSGTLGDKIAALALQIQVT